MTQTIDIDAFIATQRPEQDYIVLAGQRSPGRATIKGAAATKKWDVREGYGRSGGSTTYVGDAIARFSVEIYLWEDSQWSDWDVFAKVLDTPVRKPTVLTAGAKAAPSVSESLAMDISHPILNRAPLHITSVVVEEVSQFEVDENGGYTSTIKMIQFRAPKAALSRSDKSTPGVKKGPPTARDAIEAEIAKAKAKALSMGGKLFE